MKKKRFLVFLAAGLLASGAVRAEDAAGTPQTVTHTGKEIVVTASRIEELKKDVTTSVTVITSEEIEASPARDLGELLAETSIGHIQKYPGTMTSVGIRGFRSDTHGNDLRGKILILLDGRRAGTGNLAKLMTDNVERIEIIRGPGSVQFGSAAVGGVVNVITKKGAGKPGFFVEQEIGTSEYNKTTGGLYGTLGGFDYSASFSIADRSDYETGGGEKYFNTAYDDDFRGSLNLGYEFYPGHRIGLIYTHFEVDRAGTPDYLATNDLDDYKESLNRSIDFSYEGRTADESITWLARYFIGKDKDLTFYPPESDPSGWDDGSPYINTTEQEGAQAQVSYIDKNFTVTTGFDWLNYDIETTYLAGSEYDNPAYFVLGKVLFFDQRLVLTAGLRYDDYSVKYQPDELSDETSEGTDNLSKSFGIAYNVSDAVKLRASYGEAFVVPDAEYLAADYESFGTRYMGNPDLEPEESRTFDGGVEVSAGSLRSSLTVFNTEYDNYIASVASGPGEMTWENEDSATVTGIEGDISYEYPVCLAGWQTYLEPYVSGTYLFEYDTHFDDGSPDEPIQFVPEWNLATGIRMRDDNGFYGSLNLTFFGKTEVTDWSDMYNPVDVTKGGFYVANMAVAKKFALDEAESRSVTVKGSVENLFNRDYEFVMGYPMPGRSFIVGLRFDF